MELELHKALTIEAGWLAGWLWHLRTEKLKRFKTLSSSSINPLAKTMAMHLAELMCGKHATKATAAIKMQRLFIRLLVLMLNNDNCRYKCNWPPSSDAARMSLQQMGHIFIHQIDPLYTSLLQLGHLNQQASITNAMSCQRVPVSMSAQQPNICA